MADLTDEQRTAYCEWAIEARGGEGASEDCGDWTYTVEAMPDCRANLAQYGSCGLTVGEVDDCTDDVARDPCGFSQADGTPCYALSQCGAGS